jgi:hypothetical protein
MPDQMCYNMPTNETSLAGNQFFVAHVSQSDNSHCGIKSHSDRKLVRETGLS